MDLQRHGAKTPRLNPRGLSSTLIHLFLQRLAKDEHIFVPVLTMEFKPKKLISTEIVCQRNIIDILGFFVFFQAPSFYWELEICHLGESSSDVAHIAMGYSPDPQKPPEGQPWAYPTEAVLLRRYRGIYRITGKFGGLVVYITITKI